MSCSAAISSSHEEELHRLGQKNKRLQIQLHKQNINSIQVPAGQRPRNIVHLSYHKHDRFHCDFSFSIMGNIYVVPGSFLFLSLPLWEANTEVHSPCLPTPSLPCLFLPSTKYLASTGYEGSLPTQELASDFQGASDQQKGNFLPALFLCPTLS